MAAHPAKNPNIFAKVLMTRRIPEKNQRRILSISGWVIHIHSAFLRKKDDFSPVDNRDAFPWRAPGVNQGINWHVDKYLFYPHLAPRWNTEYPQKNFALIQCWSSAISRARGSYPPKWSSLNNITSIISFLFIYILLFLFFCLDNYLEGLCGFWSQRWW